MAYIITHKISHSGE